MKDIENCKKCEWANKQPGIIFCPFQRCIKKIKNGINIIKTQEK